MPTYLFIYSSNYLCIYLFDHYPLCLCLCPSTVHNSIENRVLLLCNFILFCKFSYNIHNYYNIHTLVSKQTSKIYSIFYWLSLHWLLYIYIVHLFLYSNQCKSLDACLCLDVHCSICGQLISHRQLPIFPSFLNHDHIAT